SGRDRRRHRVILCPAPTGIQGERGRRGISSPPSRLARMMPSIGPRRPGLRPGASRPMPRQPLVIHERLGVWARQLRPRPAAGPRPRAGPGTPSPSATPGTRPIHNEEGTPLMFGKTSPRLTEQDVLNALKGVKDPDLHRDLVDLGMVKQIQIGDGTLALTV